MTTPCLEMVAAACVRLPMRVLADRVMPNHFHLAPRPRDGGDGLSRWMQWLLTTHVRRHRRHHGPSGHVWQGRFKTFPRQDDSHLLTVPRYVERDAPRARQVTRAEAWPHGSLAARVRAEVAKGECECDDRATARPRAAGADELEPVPRDHPPGHHT